MSYKRICYMNNSLLFITLYARALYYISYIPRTRAKSVFSADLGEFMLGLCHIRYALLGDDRIHELEKEIL